jgi:hypothetical protein
MMTVHPMATWLAEVTNDAVVICRDDINTEANSNLWSFSLTLQEASSLSVTDVVEFSQKVVASRREWLTARRAPSMVMYWWHDEQAGQLRFSLVSTTHGRLPFQANIAVVAEFEEIAKAWLSSPYLDGIPWTDLQEVVPEEVETEQLPPTIAVWTAVVP